VTHSIAQRLAYECVSAYIPQHPVTAGQAQKPGKCPPDQNFTLLEQKPTLPCGASRNYLRRDRRRYASVHLPT